MKGKKGQLSSLPTIIGTLLIVGLLIGVGMLVAQEFRDQDSLSAHARTVTNESGCFINATGYTLASEDGSKTHSFAITTVFNNSDGITIESGNYSVGTNTGIVTNASTANWDDVNISYTYKTGEKAWTGVNDTIEAMTVIPSLLGLIILVIMIGIILAIIFNVMPMGRVSGA